MPNPKLQAAARLRRERRTRWLGGLLAVFALLFAAPRDAGAQLGAIGAAFGVTGEGDPLENAPIFTESALTFERGSWGVAGYGLYASASDFGLEGLPGVSFDAHLVQTTLGAAYGIIDRFTVGALLNPYIDVSVETEGLGEEGEADLNGFGDSEVFGRFQFWRSASEDTKAAVLGSVYLPTGDEEEGVGLLNGVAFSLGGALSHHIQRVTLHGEVAVDIPTDDLDGDETWRYNGALILAATDRIGISGEFLGASGNDQTSSTLAPGVRIRASENVYVDAAAQFPLDEDNIIDYVAVFGLNYVR